mmetsp:Transcript_49634/g.130888  ORF Transcript_49634/g.130888 Transcript_49634/m.130888 type:complete len:523 (+) Transcript_49634:14-1582(+)
MKVVVWFCHHNSYYNFRFRELEDVAGTLGLSAHDLYQDHYGNPENYPDARNDEPYAIITLASEEIAAALFARTVLVKFFMELWGDGPTHHAAMEAAASLPAEQRRAVLNPDSSYCFRVQAHGKKHTMADKLLVYEHFRPLFKGDEKVDAASPDNVLWIAEDYDREGTRVIGLRRVFIGRHIGQHHDLLGKKNRPYTEKYDLSQRPVLGPTTMDTGLSFLMANAIQVKPGDVVLDPFAGTGGILIAASHFGALTFGGEIDPRVVSGVACVYSKNQTAEEERRRGRGVRVNFSHYDLARPEYVVCDNASSPWRRPATGWCNAIATDPPYGIRAGAKRVEKKTDHAQVTDRSSYMPQRVEYCPGDVISDLLMFAQESLVDNGRLAFLLPVMLSQLCLGGERGTFVKMRFTETSRDPRLLDEQRYRDFLPQMDGLEYLHGSLQILSGGVGRILITMRRIPRAEVRPTGPSDQARLGVGASTRESTLAAWRDHDKVPVRRPTAALGVVCLVTAALLWGLWRTKPKHQ